jgi:DNA-binding CsgD family transcriptional regulator
MNLQWPLVGRDAELAEVQAVMATGGAGVLLIGPAGVGKTRLATEALALADLQGWRQAIVRANRSAATIPFGAFAPLLPVGEVQAEGRVDALRMAADTVASAGGDRRIMVVVDDAQELDDASEALLQLLVLHPNVFLVVTVRTDDRPIPEALTALWKDGVLTRLDIGAISPDDAAELVPRALGGPVDGVTVRMLWTTSGGNVLFLRELVVGALAAGALRESNGMWTLVGKLSPSTRLGEVVGLRIGALDDDARRAMEVVSIAEPVGLDELDALGATGAVDLLERRGLVEVVAEGARHQVRSAHPLYGEVVRAAVPVRRRQEIYRSLAEHFEAHGARRREDMLRVALWRLDGGGGEPGVLLEGAHQARFAFDFELAERLARAAHAQSPSAETAHVLGETLDMLGRHEDAELVLVEGEGFPAGERTRTMLALARSSNLFRGLGRAAESEALLDRTLAVVAVPELTAELHAQQAVHLVFEGRHAEVVEITDPLLDQVGSRAYVHGALPAAVARALAGRTKEAIEIADRAFAARVELGDQVQMAGPGIYVVARALALLEAGRLRESEDTARLGYDTAAERQLRDGQAWFGVILGRIALHTGRVATAGRWFREAALVFDDLDHPGARWAHAGLAHALALSGDLDGADAALADLDAAGPTPVRLMDPEIDRARAGVLAQRGEYTLARDVLRRGAALAAEHGSAALEATALHDLVRLGHDDDARARLHELAALVDGEFMPARVLHAEALATHDGDRFEAAADAFEALGADLYAAEAAAGAARAFVRSGLPRRVAETTNRAEQLAGQCEGARTPALAVGIETTPLTRREREVAELAARNLSSKDIAEKLFVSVRTVENHLQRAYEKLGVRSRVELADVLTPGAGPTSDPPD